MSQEKKKKVCLVVLGDIGRSPRMQYHGLSFAKEGYQVQFICYSGSKPIKNLASNENVKFQYIQHCPEFKQYFPTIFAYGVKVLWQMVTLILALILSGFSDFLLLQNPPAIPALGVCYVYCKLFRIKLIVDWHNYAYSLLGLSLGSDHSLVKISKRFEFFFGQRANHNLCVTKGMKEDLQNNHNIRAITFYDRPPDFFQKTTAKEKHRLFLKLGLQYNIFVRNCDSQETVFTRLSGKSEIIMRHDRPALLISSTSWTEDEDFSILLSALQEYEDAKESANDMPRLICAITGKGPLKEFYCKIIERRNWKHVSIITPWLEPEDYSLFLGCADLGVCLHKSSSGLDLPMKVVDMFGCLVPVCAINFQCLPELVKHKENGYIFNNEKELAEYIINWFKGFPTTDSTIRKTFEKNLQQFHMHRWHDNWKFSVQPLF